MWEQLNNPDCKPVEFEGFKMQADSNAFTMAPQKWISATGAIGIANDEVPSPQCEPPLFYLQRDEGFDSKQWGRSILLLSCILAALPRSR